MPPYLPRLGFMLEFLLALIAIPEVWSQVGGQGHLDLMPWYTKLIFISALAVVIVMGTAAAVSHDHAWNAKTIACLLIALALAAGMGAITYYYHVNENNDPDSDFDDSVAISLLAFPRQR